MFPGLPQATLRVFQALTVVSIVYVAIACARQLKRGALQSDPRLRVLLSP